MRLLLNAEVEMAKSTRLKWLFDSAFNSIYQALE